MKYGQNLWMPQSRQLWHAFLEHIQHNVAISPRKSFQLLLLKHKYRHFLQHNKNNNFTLHATCRALILKYTHGITHWNVLSPVKSSYLSLNLQQRWYNSYTVSLLTQQYLSLSLRFKGHFPGELGLAMFIEAKDDGGGGDNWTTGAITRAKFQSNHHHQQTNIPFFTALWCQYPSNKYMCFSFVDCWTWQTNRWCQIQSNVCKYVRS